MTHHSPLPSGRAHLSPSPDAHEPHERLPRGRGLGSLSSEQLNISLFGWVGRAGEAGHRPHGGGIQKLLGGWPAPYSWCSPSDLVALLVLPICSAGLRTLSAGSTGWQAGTGPGWRCGAPSNTGRSPAGPGGRLSQPAGTLCPRWMAGGRWGREGGLGLVRGTCAPAPAPAPAPPSPLHRPHPPARLSAGGGRRVGGQHSRHDLVDVEVGSPVLLDAGDVAHAHNAHHHGGDALPGLSCGGSNRSAPAHR